MLDNRERDDTDNRSTETMKKSWGSEAAEATAQV